MANALFDKAREGFLAGLIDWDTATIKAAMVDGYTPNLSTHEFVSDVTGAGGTLRATSSAFTTKTIAAGVADADNITFSSAGPAGSTCEHLIVFQSSAVGGGADVAASAQRLIAIIDTVSGGITFPVTLNGGDVTVAWDNGANRIFKL